MNFLLLLNIKEDILNNVANKILYTMEFSRDQKLFGYPHSSKYLPLWEQLEGEQMITEFSFYGELYI